LTARDYEDELQFERTYVAGLYDRLDAERAQVEDRYKAALRGDGGTLVERDVEVRALAKQVKRLQEHQSAIKAQLAETQSLMRECDARIKWNEQEAGKLP